MARKESYLRVLSRGYAIQQRGITGPTFGFINGIVITRSGIIRKSPKQPSKYHHWPKVKHK